MGLCNSTSAPNPLISYRANIEINYDTLVQTAGTFDDKGGLLTLVLTKVLTLVLTSMLTSVLTKVLTKVLTSVLTSVLTKVLTSVLT